MYAIAALLVMSAVSASTPRPTQTPRPKPLLGQKAVQPTPPPDAAPRTLADVARERKGTAKPAGSFTAAEATTSAGEEPAEKTAAEKRGKTSARAEAPGASLDREEKTWRRRAQTAREDARRADAELARAEDALRGGTWITQGNSLTPDAQREMDRRRGSAASAKAHAERAKQRIAELEEEARHSGVPPGWLR
jgi:hypothetical protein